MVTSKTKYELEKSFYCAAILRKLDFDVAKLIKGYYVMQNTIDPFIVTAIGMFYRYNVNLVRD